MTDGVTRGGKFVAIQFFLIVSTCVLYLIAAALFSKSVWFFENHMVSIIPAEKFTPELL